MGLLSTTKKWAKTAQEWGSWLLGHPNTKAAAQSSYRVVAHTLEQVPAAFAALGSVVSDKSTRKVAKHVTTIVMDLSAFVALMYGTDRFLRNDTRAEDEPNNHFDYTAPLIMSLYLLSHMMTMRHKLKTQAIKKAALDESKVVLTELIMVAALVYGTKLSAHLENQARDDNWFSTVTITNIFLYLPTKVLNTGITVLPFALRLKIHSHTMLVYLEAPELSNVSTIENICEKKGCTTLQRTEGAFYDLTTYITTEAALSLLDTALPPSLSHLINLARIHHNGRYIATVALTRLCNEHQMITLLEDPEWAFALGLGHRGSTLAVNWLLEQMTGISSRYYESSIDKLMMLFLMSVASHIKRPTPPETRTRAPDPIEVFQTSVAFSAETFLIGVRKQIENVPQGKTATARRMQHLLQYFPVPEQNKVNTLGKLFVYMLNNRITLSLLPEFMRSLERLIQDPIVRDNWPSLRLGLIDLLKSIETAKDQGLISLASALPNVTGYAAKSFLGIPPAATKLLLRLVTDAKTIEHVHKLRAQIEGLQPEKAPPLDVDSKQLQKAGHVPTTPYPSALITNVSQQNSDFLRPRKGAAKASADVIKNSSRLRFHEQPTSTSNFNFNQTDWEEALADTDSQTRLDGKGAAP